MSTSSGTRRRSDADLSWRLWKGPGLIWLVLIALFLGSIAWAYLGHGYFVLNLLIAGLMVILLATFLMDLKNARALIRMVAVAGFLWTTFMFVLIFTDYLSRHY